VLLSFQRAPDYQAPDWPRAKHGQQFHIDVTVDDVDQAEPQVLALGARRTDLQPGIDENSNSRVYYLPKPPSATPSASAGTDPERIRTTDRGSRTEARMQRDADLARPPRRGRRLRYCGSVAPMARKRQPCRRCRRPAPARNPPRLEGAQVRGPSLSISMATAQVVGIASPRPAPSPGRALERQPGAVPHRRVVGPHESIIRQDRTRHEVPAAVQLRHGVALAVPHPFRLIHQPPRGCAVAERLHTNARHAGPR
jgi:hypothetical protein